MPPAERVIEKLKRSGSYRTTPSPPLLFTCGACGQEVPGGESTGGMWVDHEHVLICKKCSDEYDPIPGGW